MPETPELTLVDFVGTGVAANFGEVVHLADDTVPAARAETTELCNINAPRLTSES